MDLGKRNGMGGKLTGVEGGETVARIYWMREYILKSNKIKILVH